jgi:hypothetical protein
MADLESSAKRFDAAMTRLVAAVEQRSARIELAEADRQRIERELADMRADFARLREASTGVSRRLDAAIGRLKGVLEEES